MEDVVGEGEEKPDRFLTDLTNLTEFGRALGQAESSQVQLSYITNRSHQPHSHWALGQAESSQVPVLQHTGTF